MNVQTAKLWRAALVVLAAVTPSIASAQDGEGTAHDSTVYAQPVESNWNGAGNTHVCPHCYSCYHGKSNDLALLRWFVDPKFYAHSPDYGWARVTKMPAQRYAVVYQRYHPDRWYGRPGGGWPADAPVYPTVGNPTDTAQLGCYYQHVPYWQPNPARIPPPPHPAQWHQRHCPTGYNAGQVTWKQLKGAQPQPVPDYVPAESMPSDEDASEDVDQLAPEPDPGPAEEPSTAMIP